MIKLRLSDIESGAKRELTCGRKNLAELKKRLNFRKPTIPIHSYYSKFPKGALVPHEKTNTSGQVKVEHLFVTIKQHYEHALSPASDKQDAFIFY
jgi:hypothetical protein